MQPFEFILVIGCLLLVVGGGIFIFLSEHKERIHDFVSDRSREIGTLVSGELNQYMRREESFIELERRLEMAAREFERQIRAERRAERRLARFQQLISNEEFTPKINWEREGF